MAFLTKASSFPLAGLFLTFLLGPRPWSQSIFGLCPTLVTAEAQQAHPPARWEQHSIIGHQAPECWPLPLPLQFLPPDLSLQAVLPRSLNFCSGPLRDLWLLANCRWAVEIWGLPRAHLSWHLLLQGWALADVTNLQGSGSFRHKALCFCLYQFTLAARTSAQSRVVTTPTSHCLLPLIFLSSFTHATYPLPYTDFSSIPAFYYDLVHRMALDRC